MLSTIKLFRVVMLAAVILLSIGQVAPASADELPPMPLNDAMLPPPEVLTMRATGMRVPGMNDPIGYYDTSVFAIGTVAVGLVLPESNGSGDPNAEDWTADEIAKVKSEVQDALAWWETQAPASADLHFVLDEAAPRLVPTSYEPINHPQSEDKLWIGETLLNLGYGSGSHFERGYAYANALRAQYNTDWAYIIFVTDSSNDPDGYFSDGWYFAYAYLGGPFLVLSFDNGAWGIDRMNQVAAHESGHMFMAGDQYAGSCSATQSYGYLGVKHTWCNSGGDSLMKSASLTLSASDPARGQVGWRDTDADGIPDPIDAAPTVTFPLHVPNPTTETSWSYAGTVEANAWPHATCSSGYCWDTDVNLTRMTQMDFQVDGGSWQAILADDGAFDEEIESFAFTVNSLGGGTHNITARGTATYNRNGTPSTVAGTTSDAVTISGPLSEGLYDNTYSNLFYEGTWSTSSSRMAYGGNFRYTTKVGSSIAFSFVGSKFGLIFTAGRVYGNVDVVVDGVKVATFSQNTRRTAYQQVYTSPLLTFEEHSVELVFASGSRMNVDAVRVYGPPDLDPPAGIVNLSASSGTVNGAVNLSWTAPAEDASTGAGTAASYLVRYSLNPITDLNWDLAVPVTRDIPAPAAPGTPQQMTVSGLAPGLNYYFAVRAQDGEPNLGGMSNSPVKAKSSAPAPLGAGKYDDKSASWVYTGTWSNMSFAKAFDGSVKYSAVIGNNASFVFTGTNFVLGYKSYSSYGTLEVYVDGIYVATINQSGTSIIRTFTLPAPLTAGEHTVQFVHKTGSKVTIDSIEILP